MSHRMLTTRLAGEPTCEQNPFLPYLPAVPAPAGGQPRGLQHLGRCKRRASDYPAVSPSEWVVVGVLDQGCTSQGNGHLFCMESLSTEPCCVARPAGWPKPGWCSRTGSRAPRWPPPRECAGCGAPYQPVQAQRQRVQRLQQQQRRQLERRRRHPCSPWCSQQQPPSWQVLARQALLQREVQRGPPAQQRPPTSPKRSRVPQQ